MYDYNTDISFLQAFPFLLPHHYDGKIQISVNYLLPTTRITLKMKGTKNDELQWDVLTCLFLSITMRLQWKEIRTNLQTKYFQYDKESFEVLLTRALNHLLKLGDLKKDDKSHQEVYYYIPKRRQQKVIDGISKRFLYKKVDEFGEKFSLDQRKRVAKDLAYSQSMIIRVERNFIKEMLSIFGRWANDSMVELNNPLQEGNTRKYSPEERIELNKQLDKLKTNFANMESNLAAEDKFTAENLKALMELSLEFQNYVVDPIYNGNRHKAIADLMRKAVDEQKAKPQY
jgi:hypothetical protein